MIFYNVEAAMVAEHERTFDFDKALGTALGFNEDDIDEREPNRMTALFKSSTTPSSMAEKISEFMAHRSDVYRVDVFYRLESEGIPQRFAVWQDGHVQYYRTRLIFEEVE